MSFLRRLTFLPLIVVSGCAVPVARTLAFVPAAPREQSCAIDFERASPREAQSKWRQIGVVCLGGVACKDTDEMPRDCTVDEVYSHTDARELLRARACAMGGEVVTPVDLCTISGYRSSTSGTEFGVYRAGE